VSSFVEKIPGDDPFPLKSWLKLNYRHVTDKQTDGQTTDRNAANLRALRYAVKIGNNKATWHMSKYKHSLTFRVRHYVVIPTKPMHRLQICPQVHN